ncbi:hypothetical protein NA57DRAFT_62953 [Rhizodiscina lignyota]|uniref:SURP motif domain-containing protein n=1 Tax=Rhizodiscina lignyota TaxID=1504668 RepID=A0A9P4IQR9_9PEZI|nr:hypothetical protein NA57DRAFT_62953 [Rhizodiscina lignyota]
MAEPTLDEITSKPPDGVIIPPIKVQDVLEKTAGYVARNPVFEQRLITRNAGDPKFGFLKTQDPYHAYYIWRLKEIREGRGTDVSAGRVAGSPQAPAKPQGPPEPPEFRFSARMPIINTKDLAVVHLTARLVAGNGKNYISALHQREANNFQFDFLRPQHSLHQFFSRLVDQYTELLDKKKKEARMKMLQENIDNPMRLYRDAEQRAAWVEHQAQQRHEKDEKEEAERVAYAEIDWHDFSLVETVLFNEADEQTDLPPPTSLNDLQSASLEQRAANSLAPSSMRIEEAMPSDEMYAPPAYSPQPPPTAAPAFLPPPPQAGYQMPPQNEEEEARIREPHAAAKGPGQMRIRNDYVPRAQAKKQNVGMALCPNCHQQIPYDELDNHMRIELLDPEWKKQKAKADSRHATTNLSTSDVANNLKRLASQRSDVFDPVTGQQVLTAEDEARKKRQQSAINYDGQPETKAELQGLNIQEQIRQIHQKYK